MFDFTFKDIQNLAQYKIKNDDDDIPLCADYLYIDRYKIMFISKFKKKYRILATSACHIRPVARLGTFDIVYFSEDFEIYFFVVIIHLSAHIFNPILYVFTIKSIKPVFIYR